MQAIGERDCQKLRQLKRCFKGEIWRRLLRTRGTVQTLSTAERMLTFFFFWSQIYARRVAHDSPAVYYEASWGFRSRAPVHLISAVQGRTQKGWSIRPTKGAELPLCRRQIRGSQRRHEKGVSLNWHPAQALRLLRAGAEKSTCRQIIDLSSELIYSLLDAILSMHVGSRKQL